MRGRILGRPSASFVTGEHWTGSPKKSIDQRGKNCPKMSEHCVFLPLRTSFGHSSGIFSSFFRHFSDILSACRFSGLSNDLPITKRAPNSRPNLHSPVWVASNGSRPQRGVTNLVVCLFLFGQSWGCRSNDRPYRNKHTTKFVPPPWGRPPFDALKPGCANSVVGLELAESFVQKKSRDAAFLQEAGQKQGESEKWSGEGEKRGGPWAMSSESVSWWTFRIFFIFFLVGEGEGRVRNAGKGGIGSLSKIPGGGGSPGGRGAEEPGGCLRRNRIFFGGRGAKIFFSGPKRPPRFCTGAAPGGDAPVQNEIAEDIPGQSGSCLCTRTEFERSAQGPKEEKDGQGGRGRERERETHTHTQIANLGLGR